MTLALDTSALLAAHLALPGREVVVEAMSADPEWCASALALGEAVAATGRLVDDPELRAELEDAVRRTWDHLHVVPVDDRCLERAADLVREQPLLVTHALHLAAADRLPRPVRYVTLDPAQIPVAMALGFEVVSP